MAGKTKKRRFDITSPGRQHIGVPTGGCFAFQNIVVAAMMNVREGGTTEIRLNGESHRLVAPATVATLIDARKPRPPFAVEVNKQLVRRPSYNETPLRDGDQVEIVTLVGGG